MSFANRKIVLSLLAASVVCLLAVEFAEAGRRGGGGGRAMSRGGPAASGSFQRNRARPQSRPRQGQYDRGSRYGQGQRQGQWQNQDREGDRQDRFDERQQNRQDRFDQRQDQIDERQDFAREVHDDREEYYNDRREWYEDAWRRGSYITVTSWNRMSCSYTTYVTDGITYYECNGVRYERVYRGGEVVYIVVP
jgi:hypothetical protein